MSDNHCELHHANTKTFLKRNGVTKLICEAVFERIDNGNLSDGASARVESMWLSDPVTVEFPPASLSDRHAFSDTLAAATHPLVRFCGSDPDFDDFLAHYFRAPTSA